MMVADKSKTIKEASDKELDELYIRLQKESQIQSIIADIKRKSSSGYVPYDYGQEISTEKPIESLYHFGIMGMRWGRRSAGSKRLSTVKKTSDDDVSEDHKKKELLKTKDVKKMSNDEIRALTMRLNLEKQHKELTKKSVSPIKKFVVDLIIANAQQAAKDYSKEYTKKGIEALLSLSKKTKVI